MSILDSLGTVFEGTLFSRAVEPKAGETAHGEPFAGACLNCGTERVGPHCHQCGQSAHIHKTMSAFMHDLLHGALHFEGKTWHTVPLLAWKPGKLTRRYIDGERARFVSPMALFLFSVFLMFAVFQIAGIGPPTSFGSPGQLEQQLSPAKAREEIADLKAARAQMSDDDLGTPFIDAQIERLEAQVAEPAAKDGEWKAAVASNDGPVRVTGRYTGVEFIDHAIAKWRENPGLMAYKLQSNSYKFSWLLIPLSLPFVALLFLWRRRFGMYDHAVFVTYSLSFMTLLYVVLVLLGGLGVSGAVLGLLGTFVPLLHIYKHLKGTYELSRFSALWRTAVLTVFIFVIVFLFIDLLLVLGAVG